MYKFGDEQRKILESLNIPMVVYQFIDMRVYTLLVTDGMCNLMCMDRQAIAELFDNDMYRDTHPDDKARVADAAYKFASGGEKFDCIYRTMSSVLGDYVIIHSHGEHFYTADGTMLSTTIYMLEGMGQDADNPLTESLASNFKAMMTKESLIRDIFYDTLTGLPNMSYFIQIADAAKKTYLKEGRSPVLVFFDLVGMKYFNEKYGLQHGDELLVEFSNILKKYYANEECGRMGSDHFALVADMDDVEDNIEAIFYDLKHANEGRNLPVHVGIYTAIFEDVSASTAIDRAKIACDMQKGIYNSVYRFYTKDIHEASRHYDYVLNNFETAMENRWIKPFYQPIIRSINGQVCDEEALARWIDPGKGMIPPDKFISVLEDAKLIHKLDLYIVDRVLEDMKKASDLGMQIVPVSINLSKYDFKLCDIVAEIEKRVKAAGFPTKLITLEVTESIATFENEFLTTQIKKVHDAGFEIWMDDFGSGYSSLNMLQDYDFDTIKFDLRFMREFANNKKSHIIMKELMQMADKLDIDTVVEGVETLEQSKFLREIGANKMQGYYWGKPNSYDDTVTIITNDIGNHPEPPEESEYYDLISKANLIEPDIDDDYIINSEEYFGPMPMGVIEYDGKHFRILRYNKTYALFLIKTNFATQEDLGKGIINVQREPEPNFIKAVNKCIESKRWENITQSEENGYLCDVFLKLISKNPNTGAVAVEIVVSSVN